MAPLNETARFEVTPEVVRAYVAALGGEWGGAHVPSGLASVFTYAAIAAMPIKTGVVLTGQRFDFHRPLAVGDHLTTEFAVTDEYERRGRQFMVVTTRTTTQDDELAVVGRITRMLPDRGAE